MIEHWQRPGATVDVPAVKSEIPVPAALATAGFFYPLVMLWGGFFVFLGEALLAGRFAFVGEGFVYFVIAHIFVLPLGFGMFLLVLIVALPIWAIWVAIRRSMDIEVGDSALAAWAGATTALVMTLLWVSWWTSGRPSSDQGILLLALLLGTATPLAQYAGAWSQWPVHERTALSNKWQFGIRQLLVATAWFAGGLGALKLLGMLTPLHMSALGGWFFYQWATAKGVYFLCRRRAMKRRGKVSEGGSK